jgi:hypothetical protein
LGRIPLDSKICYIMSNRTKIWFQEFIDAKCAKKILVRNLHNNEMIEQRCIPPRIFKNNKWIFYTFIIKKKS